MPRSSHPAIAVVNIFLLPLGLVTLVAGITGALRISEIWWAFALMAVGGAVVFGGAIHAIVAWGRAVKVDEGTAREMITTARSGQEPAARASRETGPVLAHWTYAPAEWRAHASAEIRRRTREALGGALIVAVAGTLLVGVLEWEWGVALAISVATGAFIGVGQWLVAWSAYRRDQRVAAGEVIVGPTAMLVNGRYETLHDGGLIRFSRASVREGTRPALLVVEITVPGRYRRLPDEYRIPIPAGREDEARAVAEALNHAHQALPVATAAALPQG